MSRLWGSLPAWQAFAGMMTGAALGFALIACSLAAGIDPRVWIDPPAAITKRPDSISVPVKAPRWPAGATEVPPGYVFTGGSETSV